MLLFSHQSHNFILDARIKKAMSHIPICLAKMGVGLEARLVARECMGEGSGVRIGIVYLHAISINVFV